MSENLDQPGPPVDPTPTTASTEGVNTDALRDVRSWRRAGEPDRKLAGVCAGLGRSLNVDPTILRVLFVVLAFANGLGILLYALAWLLIPEDGNDEPLIKSSKSVRTTLLVTAAVFAALIGIGTLGAILSFGGSDPFTVWPMIPIAVVVLLVLWAVQNRNDESAPTPAQAAHLGTGGADAAPLNAPLASAPKPDRGPRLFGFTLALIAVALGSLGLYESAGGTVIDAAYPATALTIIGVMLLVGSVMGRPGGLIFLGIVSLLALGATSAVDPQWNGDREIDIAPTSSAAIADSYQVPAGAIMIDLTDVEDFNELYGRTIDISANAGEIVVIVPEDAAVVVDADIRYGGQIDFPDQQSSGLGVQLHDVFNPVSDPGDEWLRLNLDLKFGHIEVRQS
jgi:phage shock protein PspC (stress-responsive transcriptional regulator)